jgi:hypothetical protein
MYKSKQLTILLHVDDLMIACEDRSGVDYVIDGLNSNYTKANVCEGNVLDYLGMIFDYSVPGEVTISMKNMVLEFLNELGISDDAKASSPASSYLFQIDDDDELLNDNEKESFHSLVAKALYMAKRGRPDILTAISFLTTRVKAPNQGDYKKLKRVGSYLNGTKDLVLCLKANNPFTLHCYVDASYAVHQDCKGRTGSAVTMGKGSIINTSTKQNIVSKSSTESEIVGISDSLGVSIGLMYLMNEQGYEVKPLILYQDNKSAITLMEKGHSTSNRTKHIPIRYYFVKDRIDKEEVKLVYMNTDDMLADFFTKPLQGELFRKLRDKIMGIIDSI